MYRKVFFPLVAAVMTVLLTSQAEAKKGFYMGLGASYNTIGGDFDGNGYLQAQGGTEVIILPDIDNAFGFDLRAGYGISETWAVELNLISSGHSGTWAGLSGDLSYVSFSVNGKYRFTTLNSTQPYLLFGISNNVLLVKDGATDISTGAVEDATFTGSGINLGAGFDVYLGQKMSVILGFLYRIVEYEQVEGIDYGTIEDGLNGSGVSFLLTTAYHF